MLLRRLVALPLLGSFIFQCLLAGACPNLAGSNPRIAWDLMIWTYSGTFSSSITAMGLAMSAWNGAQNVTNFCYLADCPGNGVDIFISDDYSITGLGEEQTFGNGSGQSGCYLHPSDTCPNMCFTEDKLYYATIKFNPTKISNTASNYSLSIDTVVQDVTAHEIGHTFGLVGYSGPRDCTYRTIMADDEDFMCSPQFFGPQSCDTNAVTSLYSGWTVYQWAVCGPLCDQGASCQ